MERKLIKAAVAGAAGKMGCRIVSLLMEDRDFKIAGATEAEGHHAVGRDAGKVACGKVCGVKIGASLDSIEGDVDVYLDFSTPQAVASNVAVARRRRFAAVIGVTGLSAAEREAVKVASEAVPVVMSPNMSIGVNLMFELADLASRTLDESFATEIVELHHAGKKDAPSGTALRLAEITASARGRSIGETLVTGRNGQCGPRRPGETAVLAMRGGDVVGEHTLFFIGNGERIEITHRAWSRDVFATGAIAAARWIAGKPAGLYDMRNVLGL